MDYNISFTGTKCILITDFLAPANYTITEWAHDREPITTSATSNLLEVDKAPNGQIVISKNHVMYEITLAVITNSQDEKFLKSLYQVTENNINGRYPTFSLSIIKPSVNIITYTGVRLIGGTYFAGATTNVYNSSTWIFKGDKLV